jgi:hypothetical protein
MRDESSDDVSGHPPDWDRALRWLPILEKGRSTEQPETTASFLDGFTRDLYDAHIIYSFDWPSWQDTAQHLVNDSSALQNASLEDLRKLLVTHVRKDRFCEGHLHGMFECGHLVEALRQVAERLGRAPDLV